MMFWDIKSYYFFKLFCHYDQLIFWKHDVTKRASWVIHYYSLLFIIIHYYLLPFKLKEKAFLNDILKYFKIFNIFLNDEIWTLSISDNLMMLDFF
jgi:hypothetical protein